MRIKNWKKFQHFKDRKPPWIKLYHDLLDNYEFYSLSDKAGKYLPWLWLIASEHLGGLPNTKDLAFRMRMSEDDVIKILKELLSKSFVCDDNIEDHEPATTKDIAEKNGFGSRHIPDTIKRQIWERDCGICVKCNSNENIEYDHIHPVSKGGNSDLDNLQLLCRSCNRKKRAKTAERPSTTLELTSRDTLDMRILETETDEETEIEKEKKQPSLSLAEIQKVYSDTFKDLMPSTTIINRLQWFVDNFEREEILSAFEGASSAKVKSLNWVTNRFKKIHENQEAEDKMWADMGAT
jgi:hypothetical protein